MRVFRNTVTGENILVDLHAPFAPEVGATVWILHRPWRVIAVHGWDAVDRFAPSVEPQLLVEVEPAAEAIAA